jgi:putative sterol carrier protein
MADATADFFAQVKARGHEPLLEKASGTLRFDLVHGQEVENWLIRIDQGDLDIVRESAPADCVIRVDRTVFDRMATGELNAMATFLRGGAAVEGDLELLVLFQHLFPGRPGSRAAPQPATAVGR